MKTSQIRLLATTLRLGLLALLLTVLNSLVSTAHAQGTAFTYQGRLDDGGAPANGVYDLRFRLYDAPTGGVQVATQFLEQDVAVSNGLFTVNIDFGSGPWIGTDRWVEVNVRPGANTGAFQLLSPRQLVTPVPYAIYSGGTDASGVTGTLPASALTGVALNATNLTSGNVSDGRLSSNVALRNINNTFSTSQDINLPLLGLGLAGGLRIHEAPLPGQSGVDFWHLIRNDANGRRVSIYAGGGRQPLVLQEQGGNVGIGTTTPATALHVSSPGHTEISLESTANNLRWTLQATGTNAVGADTFQIIDRTAQLSCIAITTNGNVGLGTTTPTGKLTVADNAAQSVIVRGTGNNITPAEVVFDKTAAGPQHRSAIGYAPDRGHFTWVNGEDRLNIVPNGRIGIGTTAPGYQLDVNGDIKTRGRFYCNFGGTDYALTSDAVVGAAFWSCDARLKEQVRTLPKALDTVRKLRGVSWNWNQDGLTFLTRNVESDFRSPTGLPEDNRKVWDQKREEILKEARQPQFGFIAQEVLDVFPGWVSTNKEGFMQIKMDRLTAFLVEAIKEQQAQIESLAAQSDRRGITRTVNAQESELSDLRAEVTRLRDERSSLARQVSQMESRFIRLEKAMYREPSVAPSEDRASLNSK